MKKMIAAVALAGAFAGAAYAADDAPRVFKPSGPWAADYGDDYCRLARNFTDGAETLSFAMDRIQPGSQARFMLIGDAIKVYRRATVLGFRYLPDGEASKAPFFISKTADGRQFTLLAPVFMGPQPEPGAPPPKYSRDQEQQFAGKIESVTFTDGAVHPVELETGDMKPVVAALQACTDDLLKFWGLDVAKHQGETRPALPDGDTAKWIPAGTIGFGDFGKLGGGANMIRLMVDAAGKPTDCKVHFASLGDATNKKICAALLANAHFLPALDAGGQPFASYYTTSPLFLLGPPPGRRR